jgi:hypothetical protein
MGICAWKVNGSKLKGGEDRNERKKRAEKRKGSENKNLRREHQEIQEKSRKSKEIDGMEGKGGA